MNPQHGEALKITEDVPKVIECDQIQELKSPSRSSRLFKGTLKKLEYVPVLLVLALSAHYTYSVPQLNISRFQADRHNSTKSYLLFILCYTIFVYLVYSSLFYYFHSMFVDPGSPKALEYSTAYLEENQIGEWSQCRKCQIWRPPRAHHCSVCDRCILKMDHHCFWTKNCIGQNNQKYFYFFLVYVCISMTISLIDSTIFCKSMNTMKECRDKSFVAGTFLLSISVLPLLLAFLVVTTWMMANGQTCVEYAINSDLKRIHGKDSKILNLYNRGFIMNLREALDIKSRYDVIRLFLPIPSFRIRNTSTDPSP